ncbi:hypothetical protein BCR33DRAFT_713979 [Rhizoclosmatium globosum]|uniref:Uncharacterized protein n=1 Tax=Rhizoclosmatium globosum TaxID=329046 RepID=A0A1Y2C8K2_9FUNG|nr:hypothetical protein BCR33DRAFT_723495 [Rhizoclosmatium globosum]ORY43276.1 hypothetical protein BCR33DRAFT_717523 [Rhizoclosmatium globosum]ORY48864.1 hypothetical protein BCR33DRAFT_713979 [Rhizoclosmatium globosum]|eukprot:ORY32481.1 hypothetical protein BCR33DRAFT_723495 [Rhizoclosmatium globosum]
MVALRRVSTSVHTTLLIGFNATLQLRSITSQVLPPFHFLIAQHLNPHFRS